MKRHDHSRDFAAKKRKHLGDGTQQRHHLENPTKKRKRETETQLTLKPNRPSSSSLTFSNRFQPIHPSSSQKLEGKRKRRRRKGKKGGSEWDRQWVFSSIYDSSAYRDKVMVVSYNLLGVENASKHRDLYYKIPSKFLDWNSRKELLCKEISHYNASILCFQEVDRFKDLDKFLKIDGYRGVYKARTGEAQDGCAMFWKENMFTLLHEENIEFQMSALRNNVAQLCILEMNENHSPPNLSLQETETTSTKRQSFVVGNIHVLFNPNRGDIKLGQVRLFLQRAYELSQEWGSIPVVIGGDLNSLPQSAMYQFLGTSKLDVDLHKRNNISGQLQHTSHCTDFRSQEYNVARVFMSMAKQLRYTWSNEELRFATGSDAITRLQHRLTLHSAYRGVPGNRRSRDHVGEPSVTSYHSRFMGTVDYIWHSNDLVPLRVLETLPVDVLRKTAGLPNEKLGSDHLALVCELAFADESNRI